MKHQGNFSIIPVAILEHKDLTDKAKLLYAQISSLTDKEGYCWATNKYLAEKHGCTSRAIQMRLSELAEHGFIRIEQQDNGQRFIYMGNTLNIGAKKNTPPVKNISPPHEIDFIPPHENNFTHNNISSNKKIEHSRPHLEKQLGEPIDHPDKVRFTDWWDAYQYQILSEQRDCVMLWQRLTVQETKQIMTHTAKYCKAQEKRYRKRPFRYLNEKEYLNEVPQAAQDKPAFTLSVQKTNH